MRQASTHDPIDAHGGARPPSARSTGFVFAAVSALAAFSARHSGWAWPLGGLSLVFAGLAWLAPAALEPLNRAWFRLSLLMSKVVTPIVMGVLFFGLITPFGYLMRLKNADPLRLKRKGGETTWWRKRGGDETNDMRKQF